MINALSQFTTITELWVFTVNWMKYKRLKYMVHVLIPVNSTVTVTSCSKLPSSASIHFLNHVTRECVTLQSTATFTNCHVVLLSWTPCMHTPQHPYNPTRYPNRFTCHYHSEQICALPQIIHWLANCWLIVFDEPSEVIGHSIMLVVQLTSFLY